MVVLDVSYLIPAQQRSPLENTLKASLSFNFNARKPKNVEKGN